MGNFLDRMDSYCNDWIPTVCKATAGLTTPIVKDTSIVQDTGQRFLTGSVRCLMFFKEVSSAHQACIYLIQSTAKNVKFGNIFTI